VAAPELRDQGSQTRGFRHGASPRGRVRRPWVARRPRGSRCLQRPAASCPR
jgi:hypothetical protein